MNQRTLAVSAELQAWLDVKAARKADRDKLAARLSLLTTDECWAIYRNEVQPPKDQIVSLICDGLIASEVRAMLKGFE